MLNIFSGHRGAQNKKGQHKAGGEYPHDER